MPKNEPTNYGFFLIINSSAAFGKDAGIFSLQSEPWQGAWSETLNEMPAWQTITTPADYPDNPFGKVDHPSNPDVSNVPSLIPANCLLDDFVTSDAATPGAPAAGAASTVGFRPHVDFPYLDIPYGAYGNDGL